MTGRGPEQGCGVSPPRGGGRLPGGPGLQPHPPESSVSHIVSCWLLGFGVGFCLPSPPHANPPSRPHCLGNALQSPHKGKLHGEAGPTRRQGKSFYGNTDITRLSRLQSQAGPERRCSRCSPTEEGDTGALRDAGWAFPSPAPDLPGDFEQTTGPGTQSPHL